ncbi:MAG TPA: hypothetical protein VFP32_01970 [Candidatus Saccharimonadales bacterium]|nr:hypothetical protein [Candidatus Saccharimonadales bacterium]
MPRHEVTAPPPDAQPEEFYTYHKNRVDLVKAVIERLLLREQALARLSFGEKGYTGSQVATARTSLKNAQDQLDANLWRAHQDKEKRLDEYIAQARLEDEEHSVIKSE